MLVGRISIHLTVKITTLLTTGPPPFGCDVFRGAGVCAITSNAQERVRRLAEASKREASAIGGIFTCGAASAAVAVASAVAAAAVGSETIEFFHPFRSPTSVGGGAR